MHMTGCDNSSTSPSRDPDTVAAKLKQILVDLQDASLGSDDAFDLLGEAFQIITTFASGHIDKVFPVLADVDDANSALFQRQAARALRPFIFSHGFYGQLVDEVIRGMWSAELGFSSPAFKRQNRSGGKYSLTEHELTVRIVHLAEYIKRDADKHEVYRAELQACGISLSSIDGYRKKLGFLSTEPLEDPYMPENIRRASEGLPTLTKREKLERAREELKNIKMMLSK